MTLKRQFTWAFALASMLVATSCLIIKELAPLGDALRMVILPGFIIDAVLSGNVHQGFGGITGVVVTTLGSVLFWAVPFWLFIRMLWPRVRDGKNKRA